MTYSVEEEIRLLKEEVNRLKGMLLPIDLHSRARMKLIQAIKKHREFRSKRQWGFYARVSMDTFYRIDKEVIAKLAKQGYNVIYEPIFSRTNSRIIRYEVRLEHK